MSSSASNLHRQIAVRRGAFAASILTDDAFVDHEVRVLLSPLYRLEEIVNRLEGAPLIVATMTSDVQVGRRSEIQTLQIDGEPERVYEFDYEEAVAVVRAPKHERWLAQHVVRLIRALYRLHAARLGGIFLHGSMVVYEGQGIAIVGQKRAGKTTSMLSFLADGADYVANDDVGVRFDGHDLVGIGSSRTVAVRNDTASLRHIARFLVQRLDLYRHPFNEMPPKGYVYCHPHELAAAFACRVVDEHPLSLLLFTCFRSEVDAAECTRLDCEETYELLLTNRLPAVDKYSDAIARFDGGAAEVPPALLRDIAMSTPALLIKQSFEKCGRLPRALVSVIDSHRQSS